jgi:hypothetical protein
MSQCSSFAKRSISPSVPQSQRRTFPGLKYPQLTGVETFLQPVHDRLAPSYTIDAFFLFSVVRLEISDASKDWGRQIGDRLDQQRMLERHPEDLFHCDGRRSRD